jgi:hypothetical protein
MPENLEINKFCIYENLGVFYQGFGSKGTTKLICNSGREQHGIQKVRTYCRDGAQIII